MPTYKSKVSVELKNGILHCPDMEQWIRDRTEIGEIPLYPFPTKKEYQNEPCIVSKFSETGYMCTKLNGKTVKVIRVIAAWYLNGRKMPKRTMYICHECNNPQCVNVNHLRIGDAKSNARDRTIHGVRSKRSRHGFTQQQVVEMRQMGANGVDPKTIADHAQINYGITVSKHWVNELCLGKVLKHWGGPLSRRNKRFNKKSRFSDEQQNEIIQMDSSGHTYSEIIEYFARKHGLSISIHRISQIITSRRNDDR